MTEDDFWDHIRPAAGHDSCWPWRGLRDENGYGRVRWRGRHTRASRVALELSIGRPVAAGMMALHSCDNPPCINPLHLREGSAADNFQDARQRGRMPMFVSAIPTGTIGSASVDEIATRYGVSRRTAYRAIARERAA